MGPNSPSDSGTTCLPTAVVELGHHLGLDVVEELGRGAKAAVYRAVRGDRSYALKIMLSATTGDLDEAAARREALLLAGVDHPSLYRIHAVGRVQGRPYLVMDLVAGKALPDLLAAGALPCDTVIGIGIDLASLLAAADRRNLVHRDVKPSNIIIGSDGAATLVDFGLVARSHRASEGDTDEVAGTLLYASPEQAGMLHRPVDGRSDLYSLGVVLFECLAGRPPFTAADVGDLLRMHAVRPPPDLRQLRPDAPTELVAIVERLLAKDPDDRYPHARELVADLLTLPSARTRTENLPAAAQGTSHDTTDAHPLVGRDRELKRLTQRWKLARAGNGGAAVVSGGRGSGRSRLLREFAATVRRDGTPVLTGRCVEADPVPLAALRAAVEDYLHDVDTLPDAAREQAVERLRKAAEPAGDLLRMLSPKLALLLPPEPAGAAPDTERQDEFAAAIAMFLAELSRGHGGLVLCLDDIQWLDDATSRVLAQLDHELANAPLLVVGASSEAAVQPANPVVGGPTLAGLAVDPHIALGALEDHDVAALLAGLLPGIEVPEELTASIVRLCQGNPLAVTEYVRAIVDAALLYPDWGRWRFDADGLDELDLPADAAQLPLSRLSEFDALGRDLFTAAAIIGGTFAAPLLAAAVEVTDDAVPGYLTRAIELGLLEQLPDGRYGFVHPHLRASLLAAADSGQLRQINHAVALHLTAHGVGAYGSGDAERAYTYAVASHFMHGDPDRDRQVAFDACWAAGRLALAEHAPAEALAFLRHAAANTEAATGAAFLATFGTALQRDGQFDEAAKYLDQALALETVPLRRAYLLSLLARVHRSLWQTSAAMQAVRQGLAELGHPMPSGIRALARTVAMVVAAGIVEFTGWGRGTISGERRERYLLRANLHETGGYAAALNLQPLTMAALDFQALYLVARVGQSAEYGQTYGAVGFLLRLLRLDRLAARTFARAAGVAQAVGDLRLVAQVAWHDAISRYLRGDDDGESLEEVITTQGRWLDVGSFCDGVGCIVVEAILRGHAVEGARWLEIGRQRVRSREMVDRTGLARVELAIPAVLGRAAEAGMRWKAAEKVLADEDTDQPLRIALLVAGSEVLVNQDDIGDRFASAMSTFAELHLPLPLLMRYQHPIFVARAEATLASYRASPPEQRTARRTAARRAIRTLRLVARTPLLRAYHRIAAAELCRIDGRPQRALAMLERIRPPRRDAPLVAYHAAVARARCYRDLGQEDMAARHARMAFSEADERGWPHRRRQVAAEFSLAVGLDLTGTRGVQLSRAGSSPGLHAGNAVEWLAALQQVGQAASRVVDPSVLARIALDEMIKILAADRAFLFLTEGDDQHLVPHVGRDSEGRDITQFTTYSASLVERVREAREALVVTGTDEGEALGSRSVVVHGLRSILAAPLQLDDRLLGVVYLDSQVAKGIFTNDDLDILTPITNHIAVSLETARAAQLDAAIKMAERERDVAETLRTALTEMSSTLSPAAVIDHLLRSVTELLPGRVRFVREDGSSFETTAETAPSGGRHRGRDLSEDAAAWLRQLPPTTAVWPGDQVPELAATLGPAASWLIVPLTVRGQRIGTVVLDREDAPYDTTQTELAATLAAQAMIAYDNARLFTKVERMATVDALTGLPNRRAFFEQAEREVASRHRTGRHLGALMIDIDFFKRINDSYGHQTGDEVLHHVAKRLAAGIRDGDLLARYGGEEFVVLLIDADNEPSRRRIEQLRCAVGGAPVDTRHAGPVPVTISLGMAYLADDEDLDQLLVRADAALYRAKHEGRDRLVIG